MLVNAMEKNKTGRDIQVGLKEELNFSIAPEKVSKNLKINY